MYCIQIYKSAAIGQSFSNLFAA